MPIEQVFTNRSPAEEVTAAAVIFIVLTPSKRKPPASGLTASTASAIFTPLPGNLLHLNRVDAIFNHRTVVSTDDPGAERAIRCNEVIKIITRPISPAAPNRKDL
jgi:hypothetical protein